MRMSERIKPKEYKQMRSLLTHPSVRSWRAIMGAFQTVLYELEKGLMSEGFHLSRFQIFLNLYFDGPLSAADLARRLFVTRGNVSTFLKRLERDKHIMVCASSRSQSRPLYRLTLKAEKIFEDIFPRHIQRVKGLVPELPESLVEKLTILSANTNRKDFKKR